MTRKAVRILLVLLTIFGMSIAHVATRYFFPFPLNMVNTIFVVITLFLVIRESGVVVWLSFFSHLLIELYTVAPFGITLFSGTVSALLVYWLFQTIFTNRSWYTAMILAASTTVIYRACYSLLLLLVSFEEAAGSWSHVGRLYLWETLLTLLTVGLFFFLLRPFIREFRKDTIYA